MPKLLTIPPMKYFKLTYGGRLQTAVGYMILNDNLKFKARCETLIFNNDCELFLLKVKRPWNYEIPGGTVEIKGDEYLDNHNILDLCTDIAKKEILEEAYLVVNNLNYTYMYRTYKYEETGDNIWQKKLADSGFYVVGDISLIFSANYLGNFTNEIEEIDKYKEMKQNGTFYKFKEVEDILEPEHKAIWLDRLNKIKKDPLDEIFN